MIGGETWEERENKGEMDVEEKERRGLKSHLSLTWIHIICNNNIDFNHQAVGHMLSICNSWWINSWRYWLTLEIRLETTQVPDQNYFFQNPFTVIFQEYSGLNVWSSKKP